MNWAKRPDYLDCMNPKAANNLNCIQKSSSLLAIDRLALKADALLLVFKHMTTHDLS